MAEEFGDYLFTLAEYGRRLGLKANSCLDVANNKFLTRYKAMLQTSAARLFPYAAGTFGPPEAAQLLGDHGLTP